MYSSLSWVIFNIHASGNRADSVQSLYKEQANRIRNIKVLKILLVQFSFYIHCKGGRKCCLTLFCMVLWMFQLIFLNFLMHWSIIFLFILTKTHLRHLDLYNVGKNYYFPNNQDLIFQKPYIRITCTKPSPCWVEMFSLSYIFSFPLYV